MPITVSIDGRLFKSVDVGLKVFERGFRQAFDKAARPISKELKRALQQVAREMGRRHSTPWSPGGSPRARLFRRTGGGVKGIKKTVKVKGTRKLETIVGQVGAPFPISVHEKGATIRAKRSKFLTIPLPAAMDSRGVPLRKKARDWPNTFVQKSRRGNLLIFRNNPDGTITPLYLLRKSVKLPPRLGMEKELRKQLGFFQAKMISILDRKLAQV